jgi:hypothetical protein
MSHLHVRHYVSHLHTTVFLLSFDLAILDRDPRERADIANKGRIIVKGWDRPLLEAYCQIANYTMMQLLIKVTRNCFNKGSKFFVGDLAPAMQEKKSVKLPVADFVKFAEELELTCRSVMSGDVPEITHHDAIYMANKLVSGRCDFLAYVVDTKDTITFSVYSGCAADEPGAPRLSPEDQLEHPAHNHLERVQQYLLGTYIPNPSPKIALYYDIGYNFRMRSPGDASSLLILNENFKEDFQDNLVQNCDAAMENLITFAPGPSLSNIVDSLLSKEGDSKGQEKWTSTSLQTVFGKIIGCPVNIASKGMCPGRLTYVNVPRKQAQVNIGGSGISGSENYPPEYRMYNLNQVCLVVPTVGDSAAYFTDEPSNFTIASVLSLDESTGETVLHDPNGELLVVPRQDQHRLVSYRATYRATETTADTQGLENFTKLHQISPPESPVVRTSTAATGPSNSKSGGRIRQTSLFNGANSPSGEITRTPLRGANSKLGEIPSTPLCANSKSGEILPSTPLLSLVTALRNIPRGIHNPSNMCYAIASIQVLLSCSPLLTNLEQTVEIPLTPLEQTAEIPSSETERNQQDLLVALRISAHAGGIDALIAEMKKNEPFFPQFIDINHQEDVAEFLTSLFSTLCGEGPTSFLDSQQAGTLVTCCACSSSKSIPSLSLSNLFVLRPLPKEEATSLLQLFEREHGGKAPAENRATRVCGICCAEMNQGPLPTWIASL